MDSKKEIPQPPIECTGPAGDIKINHAVVASIVRLTALEVDGVCSVGGGLVDGLAEIFSKRESDRGVRVLENENGTYSIELRVILRFGVELAVVAEQIQRSVAEQVAKMTQKTVERVDVVIDGVKAMVTAKSSEKSWSGESEN